MWVTRDLDASAADAWAVLVDLDRWPSWGPSVRSARLADGGRRLHADGRGTVRTALGPTLPFVVTGFDEGREWSWRVAGVAATAHRVDPLGADRCRVGMRVPWWAPPYAVVCAVALRRIGELAAAGS